MHKSAHGEAFYRDVLLQMQSEFARAVAALEKQISCLTEHNELLTEAQQQQQTEVIGLQQELAGVNEARGQELEEVNEARRREQQCASDTIRRLQEELAMQHEDFRSEKLKMQTSEQSLQHECSALKLLLQQEQGYWARFEKTKQAELEKMHLQVAEAKAESMQSRDRNDSLCREMKLLQNRVDAAVRTSRNFEQRLKILSHQKHDEQRELEAEVLRLKRKVSEKREQNKYLSEALVAREESAAVAATAERRRQRPTSAPAVRSPSSISSTSSVFSDPVTESTLSSQYQPTIRRTNPTTSSDATNQKKSHREQEKPELVQPAREKRLRKRDITLSMPSIKRTSSAFETKLAHDDLHLHAPTSPTASSPDMTPPSTPHRQSGVASNATTTSNNNNNNNTISTSSRQPSSQRTGIAGARTTRLDREMSDLRRKLDACMQFNLSS
ncbi:hypothetical protein Gpo141_00012247 [Globisporangium polare]